ncbi:S8 family serine peptidase [Mycoplasmoides gallisepticum]|uniref:Peptidase S8 n=2 Tax=Mycoplasmoides gallisepticum TaxID=2096 RepID=A0A0F6CK55_MYCGL|nr:S8 family serine peptidase [Mycoplasmoides gallisepticum]AHB99477.1 peptidase S8 [Mycoplasmoides gallisepticum S6]QEX45704.1 S8 family serine peptidase [Mycoplasmoides gallisepticum]
MRIKNLISFISLGIITTAVPFSAILNNNKSKVDHSKDLPSNQNSVLVNNNVEIAKQAKDVSEESFVESNNSLYDFENNDYYDGFITFNGNVSIYDKNSILELIKKQPQVLDAKKSLALDNYYLVNFFFRKGSNDKERFDSFLKKYDLIGDFYIIDENKNDKNDLENNAIFNRNHTINNSSEKYENKYNRNFSSNGYTDDERNKAIAFTRNQITYGREKRIGVAVLEVGESYDMRKALIDANDSYYFNPKVTNVWNRFDPYVFAIFPIWPLHGQHATEVGSVISGTNGVNPYHDLYGVKVNTEDFHAINGLGAARSGLENEIAYIKGLNNVKVVNNSWAKKVSWNNNPNLFKYNYYSRYLDLLTANENEMIYVFAAGNEGNNKNEKFRHLYAYQLSYNSIIVGSNTNYGYRSSFTTLGSDTHSPFILANGSEYPFYKGTGYGTSFASPFVSGVLANTLHQYREKYKLGINSIIAKAVLGVSSSDVSGYPNTNQAGLHRDYGVGLLDYKKINSAFNNLNYIRWNHSSQVILNNRWTHKNGGDGSLIVKSVPLKKGDKLRIGLSWLFKPSNSISYNNNNKENADLTTTIDFTDQDFNLYLKKDGKVIYFSKTKNNFEFIKYGVVEDGNYEIVVSKYTQILPNYSDTQLALSWTVE